MAELYQTSLLSDANLKAYYRFESGALTTDSSGENHTLTAISDPAEISGKFGGAVSLDGDDAYSIVDHADFKPTGNFSVGVWVKNNGGTDDAIFYSFTGLFDSANFAGWYLAINGEGKAQLTSGKNTGWTSGHYASIVSTTSVNNNAWNFIVGTWDGSYLRIYVNGASDATPVAWANAPAYAATNYVRVGCRCNAGSNDYFLTGSLDDVFLFNGTALTSDQIQSLYCRGFKTINGVAVNAGLYNNPTLYSSSYLKAYYRFKEGALTTDDSGEGHTLTAISVPIEGAGKFGGGIYLAGDDAYSAVDHADFKPTGAFTVGCWVKVSSIPDDSFCLISYSQNTAVAGWGLYVGYVSSTVGYTKFISGKNTGTTINTDFKQAVGTVDIVDGNWHFIVATWDGSNIKVYTDGGDEVSVAWANAPAYAATNYVRVGCNNLTGTNTQFFTGSLDDVFLFNGLALSADQIRELYSGGIKTLNGLAIASVKSFNGIG